MCQELVTGLTSRSSVSIPASDRVIEIGPYDLSRFPQEECVSDIM